MPDKIRHGSARRDLRERDRETPIFMITAYGSVEVAVEALKRGANDYFAKPWDNEKLLIEIERMIAGQPPGAREYRSSSARSSSSTAFRTSSARAIACCACSIWSTQVAPSRATILITGETGTGKELIAKAIHAHSARSEPAFVPVQ